MKQCNHENNRIKQSCPYNVGVFCAYELGMVNQLMRCDHCGESKNDG